MWVYETSSLQILNVNPAAIKKYGYSETEFLNMSVLRLLSDKEKQKIHDLTNPQFNDSNKRMEHKLKDGKVNFTQLGSKGYQAGGPANWTSGAQTIIKPN